MNNDRINQFLRNSGYPTQNEQSSSTRNDTTNRDNSALGNTQPTTAFPRLPDYTEPSMVNRTPLVRTRAENHMTLPAAERPAIQASISIANLNDLVAADILMDLGEHLQTEPNDNRLIIDGLQITNERQPNNTEPNSTQRLNEPSTPTTRPTPALRRAQHRQAFVSRPSNPLNTTFDNSRSHNTLNDRQLNEPSAGLLSRLDRPATLNHHGRRPAIFMPFESEATQPGAFRQNNTHYMQPPGIQQVVHHETVFNSQGSIMNPARFIGDISRGISSEITNERGTPVSSEYIPVATPYFEATVEPLQDATRLQRNSQGELLNDVGEPEFLQEAEVTDITLVNRPNQRPDATGEE